MYPRIVEIPLPFEILGSDVVPVNSYGAMMAVGFLVAAWLLRKELDRLYHAGKLEAVQVLLPVKRTSERRGAARSRKVWTKASPKYLVETIVVIAVVAGLAGARLFHILENLDDFSRNPFGMIFSTGGLTFYGGLLVCVPAILAYVHRKGVQLSLFADSAMPTVLLAYGIGRIGCHLAGDGDWGIASNVAAQPSWVPTWLWAETYPNNILGVTLPETGVYPTPLYEFGMALVLFSVLWFLRKHPFRTGWLFWLSLLFVGVERILIEQIRVNNTYDVIGLSVTQAEIISAVLIMIAVIGLALTMRSKGRTGSSRRCATPTITTTSVSLR